MLHRFKTYEKKQFENLKELTISTDFKDWVNSLKIDDFIYSEIIRVLEEDLNLEVTKHYHNIFIIEDKYIMVKNSHEYFRVAIWDKKKYSDPFDMVEAISTKDPKFTLKEVYQEIKKLKEL
jgi:hypothetical protein